MCGASGTVVARDPCEIQGHYGHPRASSDPNTSVEKVWKETQQLMEQSEHLVRVMTHVCSQQLSGVFRTVAKYSQDCWRRCGPAGMNSGGTTRHPGHPRNHPPTQHCPEGRKGAGVQCEDKACGGTEACQGRARWRGWGDRCQCDGQCHQRGVMDSGGIKGPPPHHSPTPSPTPSHCPPYPDSLPSCPGESRARGNSASSNRSSKTRRGCSRGSYSSYMPAPSSLLTILLLLVASLPRFTEGCSSRSTPKPRPPSPTMRPNITYQTYSCPPTYAAWYCLNGATCFTIRIGESILYNCECADGYMGQRCEFKDLDGSYLTRREKVQMETASIAGGATVACVLVFVVLFAVYVFMQRDKDKRYRDPDDVSHNDRQPFSGYQNPRPEVLRNPYARTMEELSHVEVQPVGGPRSPASTTPTPHPSTPDPS